MRRAIKKLFVPMLLTLAVIMPWNVHAANGSNYTLTVSFMKEDHTVPIDGAGINIYQVADADVYTSWALYRVKNTYKSLKKTDDAGHDITFDGLSASQSNALAKKFSKIEGKAVASGTTSKKGSFTSTGLKAGMYLVTQTERSGSALKYETFDPFFVSVPMYADGSWNETVTVEPKTGSTPIKIEGTDTPPDDTITPPTSDKNGSRATTPPKTGDEANMWLWIGIMTVSGCCALALLVIAGRKKKEAEEEDDEHA